MRKLGKLMKVFSGITSWNFNGWSKEKKHAIKQEKDNKTPAKEAGDQQKI
jgi:hypothetical protein